MGRGFSFLWDNRFFNGIKVQGRSRPDLGIQMKFILFYFIDKNSGMSYTVTVIYNTVTKKGACGRMSEPEKSTLELIHAAAKAEFMEKGFQAASLRNMVKTAGVTTGAFYGYYDSKEELFAALVDPSYEYMMERYRQAHEYFESLPMEKQPEQIGKMSSECMNELLAYSCEHMDEVYLILKCSEGTKYVSMIDDMAELEVESTHKYYKVLEQLGTPAPKIDERLEHIMATGMIGAFFEMVLHRMPFEDAKVFLQQLNDFYTAGWMKIMEQ